MNKTEFLRVVDEVSIDINDFSDKIREYKKSHKRKYESIKLRRELVEIMFSRTYNKREIAEFLGVHQQTVTRDIQWLKSAAKKEMTEKLEKKFPGEYHRYSVVIDEVLRLSWDFDMIKKLIRPERLHIKL
jgi:IS30 family transposase